jgi:cytochrome c oxidase subunit 2
MPLAVVLILLVVGSLLFHLLSPWTFTELASNWGMVDFTVDITLYVTGFVFVVVNLFMAYCVIKFRYRKGARATYEPENKKLETILTSVTAILIVLMLTPGLFVWAKFVDVPEEAHVVEAVGQQWHWSFRLPGEDGKLGEVDAERITNDNPFGMDPDDPYGQDDVLIRNAEIHVPVDKPVKFLLRSKDVLHNFTVAQFRVKMDLVPGMQTFLWLTPTKEGRFELLCEELCGIGHHTMRGAVMVDSAADYETWLANQSTYSALNAKPAGNADLGAAQYAVCATCHGQQGEGIVAMNAPKIAGQSAWYLKRQIMNYKKGLRGAAPGDTFGQQMTGMVAMLVDEQAVDNVVAHIGTFPDHPVAATSAGGDAAAGAKQYNVCAYCHGKDGMGIQALNAPRVAGMSDWYIERQLHNFRDDVRGSHPQDYYGFQMGLMGQSLHDEQAVKDLIAYINTL